MVLPECYRKSLEHICPLIQDKTYHSFLSLLNSGSLTMWPAVYTDHIVLEAPNTINWNNCEKGQFQDTMEHVWSIYLNIFCFAVFTTMFTQNVALSSLQTTHTNQPLFKNKTATKNPYQIFPHLTL